MNTPANHSELIPAVNESLELNIPAHATWEELHSVLTAHISGLVNSNLEKLVFYLYRIDVDEKRMRTALDKNKEENAASIIADLVIERQLEKIKSRQEHRRDNTIKGDEEW
jgi:hypothetical protein